MANSPRRRPRDPAAPSLRVRLEHLRVTATQAFESAAERIPVVGAIVQAAARERSAGGVLLAGGVAYRLFFWLVPLGLVSATIASFFTTSNSTELTSAAASRGLTGVAAAAAGKAIDTAGHNAWYLLTFGAVFVIWFGYGVVRALAIVYALAWGERPRTVRNPLLAGAAFTTIAFVLTIAAAGIGSAIARIGLGSIATLASTIIVYAAAALGISVFFPHANAPARALLPGSFLLSAGGLGLHVFVDVYLAPKLGRSVDLYGMLGASTVILLWLYMIARLVTLSAFLNATLWMRRLGADSDPSGTAPATGH